MKVGKSGEVLVAVGCVVKEVENEGDTAAAETAIAFLAVVAAFLLLVMLPVLPLHNPRFT